MFSAIGQLPADGLLDYAKGVCDEVLVFTFGHGAIMARITGAYQPQEFQTVPLPNFHLITQAVIKPWAAFL